MFHRRMVHHLRMRRGSVVARTRQFPRIAGCLPPTAHTGRPAIRALGERERRPPSWAGRWPWCCWRHFTEGQFISDCNYQYQCIAAARRHSISQPISATPPRPAGSTPEITAAPTPRSEADRRSPGRVDVVAAVWQAPS